jgi:hypothetical protein
MVQRPPFKQESAGLDLNLLEYAFHDPAEPITDVELWMRHKIILPWLIDGHEYTRSSRKWSHLELVHIARGARSICFDNLYRPVMFIHNNAMASREALVLCAREETDMLLAPVLAWPRSMYCSRPTQSYPRPYQVAPGIVYIWPRIQILVRRDEYVSRLDKFRSQEGKVYYRRVQVGSLRCRQCVSESMTRTEFGLCDDNSGIVI